MAYNDDKVNPVTAFLTERGVGHGVQEDPRATRERERNDTLTARSESVKEWRRWIATQTPASDLSNLQAVREMTGLSIAAVGEIVGASVADVESAEAGRQSVADGALRAFIGGALSALEQQGGENA